MDVRSNLKLLRFRVLARLSNKRQNSKHFHLFRIVIKKTLYFEKKNDFFSVHTAPISCYLIYVQSFLKMLMKTRSIEFLLVTYLYNILLLA